MRTLCGTILAAVLSLSANANSVASFCERAQKGDRLTVAFLGGSLSWGANATDPNKASWRALVGRRLEERYPDAHFKFIDAAIGGTDSGLGIFRLERDVMPCKPDIVFVEWLVNDGERKSGDDCSCSYEGIVRHYVRAGTFDFLCSRWQDGLAVAANCAFNPKTLKRELVPSDVEPLRAKFRGEVLMLYGESAEWSPKCEVFVDGKPLIATHSDRPYPQALLDMFTFRRPTWGTPSVPDTWYWSGGPTQNVAVASSGSTSPSASARLSTTT